MKFKNAIHNLFDRNLTVVLAILGFIAISFVASAGQKQYVSQGPLTEMVKFSQRGAKEVDAGTKHGKTKRCIHAPVHGKVKIKGFYKQYFLAAIFKFSCYHQYLVPLVTSFVTFAFRPEYYNFLFRYTPF